MNVFEYKNMKKKNYFEGWYQRITDENNNINYAFIFAISKDQNDPHSFIQVFDGVKNESTYYRFAVEDFYYSKDTVYIKDNYLSIGSMYIKIGDLEVNVLLTNSKHLKKYYRFNSAMSYLSIFPLKCFQEVVSVDGSYNGEIIINDNLINTTGKSYTEKTYGNKFPEKWLWIQGNHFNKDVSLTFAHGLIPFFKWKLKGFMAIINYNSKEFRFASYNFSRMKIIKRDSEHVEIMIKRRRYKLIINAKIVNPVKLVGPSEGGVMNLDVFESISSLATLTFYKGKKVIFDTMGRSVGFENMYD